MKKSSKVLGAALMALAVTLVANATEPSSSYIRQTYSGDVAKARFYKLYNDLSSDQGTTSGRKANAVMTALVDPRSQFKVVTESRAPGGPVAFSVSIGDTQTYTSCTQMSGYAQNVEITQTYMVVNGNAQWVTTQYSEYRTPSCAAG